MNEDLYELLGVLPQAEDVVITAAYRALAQRYHPDRWTGSSDEAHERMTAINRAYVVLKDPASRAAYDAERAKAAQAHFEPKQDDERAEAFDQALSALEARWSIAVDVFPDLATLRQGLAMLSTGLAFSYVTTVLETKAFNDRKALADRMRDAFLERYFGADSKIKATAQALLEGGHRKAAQDLNELIDVIGLTVGAERLLAQVYKRHPEIRDLMESGPEQERRRSTVESARAAFRSVPTAVNLGMLCRLTGYSIEEHSQGFFRVAKYRVQGPNGLNLEFPHIDALIDWGKQQFLSS
jgi:curved DNA-binding protein CbpA